MTYLPPAHSPLGASHLARAALGSLSSRERVEDLRRFVADRFGAERVILSESGTQALELAIRVAGRRLGQPGVPIALPAYSCFDLVSAAVGAGHPLLFYDLTPGSLSPDTESLYRAVEQGARVIVASPLYGYPIDWRILEPFRVDDDFAVIEDAAQGVEASWEGRMVGTLGDLTVLSFGRGKGWTGGGGGALLLRGAYRDDADTDPSLSPTPTEGMRRMFVSIAQWILGRPPFYGIPARIPWLGLGETRYLPPVPPRRIPAFSAGLALATAPSFQTEAAERPGRLEYAQERLLSWAARDGRMTPVEPVAGGIPTYLRLPLIWRGDRTSGLMRSLRALGVAAGYPRILPDLEAARDPQLRRPAFPGASILSRHLLTLPTHRYISDRAVDRTIEILEAAAV